MTRKLLRAYYKVFHSPCEKPLFEPNIVLVNPESPGNIGSVVRAMANFGLSKSLIIVGNAVSLLKDPQCSHMAVRAKERLKEIVLWTSWDEFYHSVKQRAHPYIVATSSVVGSSKRPHPRRLDDFMTSLFEKVSDSDSLTEVFWVFGSESIGLTNSQIADCDVIVTIPSHPEYRSLNLAQAVVIFLYEWYRCHLTRIQSQEKFSTKHYGEQTQRLIEHWVHVAQQVGFILPGDPFKMRSRFEKILSQLPHDPACASTLHGFLNQIIRCLESSGPRFKGRYRSYLEKRHRHVRQIPT